MLRGRFGILVFCFYSVSAISGPATDRLNAFFSDIKSMRADFVQTVKSKGFTSVERLEGVLQMLRPGRFRWDYHVPYEQMILGDGKHLWIYDIDLDQVIVKPLDDVLANTPAVLLSGRGSLADRFNIKEIPPRNSEGLLWVELSPIENDSGFQRLILAFSDTELRQMELTDVFDQVTLISFSNFETNPKLAASVFQFIPPPGVDVIGETIE